MPELFWFLSLPPPPRLLRRWCETFQGGKDWDSIFGENVRVRRALEQSTLDAYQEDWEINSFRLHFHLFCDCHPASGKIEERSELTKTYGWGEAREEVRLMFSFFHFPSSRHPPSLISLSFSPHDYANTLLVLSYREVIYRFNEFRLPSTFFHYHRLAARVAPPWLKLLSSSPPPSTVRY